MITIASSSRLIGWIAVAAALCMPSVLHAYDAQSADAPTLRITPMTKAPTIDGVLTPGEWDGAAVTNSFHVLGSQQIASPMTQVMVGYDQNNIYLAAKLPFNGAAPSAVKRDRDGTIYMDEGLELFLDPQHTNMASYQFACNALGSICDTKDKDPKWNGEWTARTSQGNGEWYLEMAIPFSTLGISPSSAERMLGFNVCLNRKNPEGNLTWAPLLEPGGFHQPGKFGHLILASQVGSLSCVQVTLENEVAFMLQGISEPVQALLEVSTLGKKLGEKSLDGALPSRLTVPLAEPNKQIADGVYDWRLSVKEPKSGGLLYRMTGSTEVWRHVRLSLRRYFLQGRLGVDAIMPASGTAAASATVSIVDMAGKQLMTESKPVVDRKAAFLLDISKLPFVECKAVVEAKDAQGQLLSSAEQRYTRPAVPEWMGSQAGISDKVLAPWTPIKLKKSGSSVSISSWGRTYTFAGSPFPKSVLTNKASILNGPIAMKMLVDGKPVTLNGKISVTKQSESQVILDGIASAGSLSASSHVVMDFDGNAFIDVVFTGKQDVTIDKLSVEIPIKSQYAKYRHYFPTPYASSENARAIPAAGWQNGFVSYLWVGDEDRGIALYTTSDENWTTGLQTATVKPTGKDTMTMAFNMITSPLKFTTQQLAKGVAYRLGLQATPVKQPDKDTWDYRICHSGEYGLQDAVMNADASLSYNSPTLLDSPMGTIDLWVKLNFDPNVPVPEGASRGQFNRPLYIISNGQDQLVFYWNIDVRGMRAYFFSKGQFIMLGDVTSNWKQGELHHLSLSWSDAIRIVIDGKLEKEYPMIGLMNGLTPASAFSLQVSKPGFSIETLRVSDVVREPELPTAPYQSDAHTRLLEQFNTLTPLGAERTATKPEVGPNGEIAGSFDISADKMGKLISVSTSAMPALDYLKSMGYKTIVFHEHWTDVQNWPEAVGHEQQLKALVKACHEKGFQILVYFGYEISDIMTTWLDYKDEVMVKPDWQSYTRSPAQKDYVVCYESVWQDFIADGVGKVMDKYDIDGVYLDSTALPFWCSNTMHGCGYTRPDGTIAPTFEYRGTREMLRRLYTVVKSRKPDGQVNLHNSGYAVTPSIGWATSTWDGEHFTVLTKRQPIDEVIPLDAFRAEFMGRQYGVPSEFLCYDMPYTFHESYAMTLLHDLRVRGRGYAMKEEAAIFKAMDAFGRKQSVWHPYWNNAKLVSVSGDKAYCSVYLRKGLGAMCVVSSFSSKTQKLTVKLNLKAMGLTKATSAVNMMNGEKLPLQNGEFVLPTIATDYGMVWVK